MTRASICVSQSGTTINITAKRSMFVSLTISNIIGVPVIEFRRLFLSKGRNNIDLCRFHLSPGIYVLVLDGENIHIVKRIVIIHE